jgi:hypothetical protein
VYLPYEEADVVLPTVVNRDWRDGGANGDPIVGLDEAGAMEVVAAGSLVRVGLPKNATTG